MAACATLLSMGHERKVENLRAFMVKFADSRGFSLPQTKLFDKKFLDLCLSTTPDHPTYSEMIFVAITELNEEGGSCEEAISEFIHAKYKSLPFAHKSLLSHHLAKLVEKREVLCDYNSYCYTLPGDNEKSDVSIDAERKSLVITLRRNDRANETVTHRNGQKVDLLKERSLRGSKTRRKRRVRGDINVVELSDTEDNGVEACLGDSAVETLREEEVAEEPILALENSETEGRIEPSNEGGELYGIVAVNEQNDVVMEKSGKGEKKKAELLRISNTVKEACVDVKSDAYKRLWERQTEACGNIIALEKMLKQCREKDQQVKAVSEIDDVSRLPLSMESCKELRKLAQKIESQLSVIIDSTDLTVVPYKEPQGCEMEGKSRGSFNNGSKNGSEKTSKELEEKEREIDLQKKPQAKKTRVRRFENNGAIVLRKSPIIRKPVVLKD